MKVVSHTIKRIPSTLLVFLLLSTLLSGISVTSHAGIYFNDNGVSADSIEIFSQSPALIDYQFSVDFSPRCTSGCTGTQNYRLGLSDNSIGNNVSGAAPESLTVNDLSQTMQSTVTFTDSSNSDTMSFTLGNWSGAVSPNSENVTARFSVTLLKSRLEALAINNEPLTFYIVGEDVESTRYHDSILATIPVTRKPEVKVSGLTDVALSEQDVNGSNLDGFLSACLYSTTGEVTLDFDGSTVPGQLFKLSNKNDCSGNSECLPYRLHVKNSSKDWTRYRQKNHRPDLAWSANSMDDSCGGNSNLDLRIRIRARDLPSEAGVYKDTMTITVSPK